MTHAFNEIAKDPVSWLIGGLLSCTVAHALMIPLGTEEWLHGLFGLEPH